jgi:hypothetical protein
MGWRRLLWSVSRDLSIPRIGDWTRSGSRTQRSSSVAKPRPPSCSGECRGTCKARACLWCRASRARASRRCYGLGAAADPRVRAVGRAWVGVVAVPGVDSDARATGCAGPACGGGGRGGSAPVREAQMIDCSADVPGSWVGVALSMAIAGGRMLSRAGCGRLHLGLPASVVVALTADGARGTC